MNVETTIPVHAFGDQWLADTHRAWPCKDLWSSLHHWFSDSNISLKDGSGQVGIFLTVTVYVWRLHVAVITTLQGNGYIIKPHIALQFSFKLHISTVLHSPQPCIYCTSLLHFHNNNLQRTIARRSIHSTLVTIRRPDRYDIVSHKAYSSFTSVVSSSQTHYHKHTLLITIDYKKILVQYYRKLLFHIEILPEPQVYN